MPAVLRLLLGPTATEFLAPALGEVDAELTDVRVCEAHVAPSGGVRVRYRCRVRRADGAVVDDVLVAATGDGIPPGATLIAGVFEDAPAEVGLWRWPHDPVLPGLAVAANPARLAERLRTAGIPVKAVPRLSIRGYRPGHRAVVEAHDGTSKWFVKVVAPQSVSGLRQRHALLADALPVPPVLVADPDGLVVLPELPGTLMRQASSADMPKPAVLNEILDSLPAELMALPRRPSHLQRVGQSLRVLEMTLGARHDLDEFRSLPTQPDPVLVPVHGDFHDGQVLVRDGGIAGVLDVDTAGPGERADEWATLLGHLSVRSLGNAVARKHADEVLAYAERHVDAHELRARTAAVVLGLANGPFRTQRPGWADTAKARLSLARGWLDSMREASSPIPSSLTFAREC